jgi:hypothetical protein
MPTMATIKDAYTTAMSPMDLKGAMETSRSLATTVPLFVRMSKRVVGFTSIAFHAVLYSHGTTFPFRPVVVRRLAQRLDPTVGVALNHMALDAQVLENTLRSGSASHSNPFAWRSWTKLGKDVESRVPPVPFQVTERIGTEVLLFEREDVRERQLLWDPKDPGSAERRKPEGGELSSSFISNPERHRHRSEAASAMGGTKTTPDASSVSKANRPTQFKIFEQPKETEGIFEVLPNSSFKCKLYVPPVIARHVEKLNQRTTQAPEFAHSAESRAAEGSSGSTNGPRSKVIVHELVINATDYLYVPAGWKYSLEPVPVGGFLAEDQTLFVAPKKDKWPRQEWEHPDGEVQDTLTRIPAAAQNSNDEEFSYPGLLRHSYKRFPVLSQEDAILERGMCPTTVRDFYHPKLPDYGLCGPPPAPAIGSALPTPRFKA